VVLKYCFGLGLLFALQVPYKQYLNYHNMKKLNYNHLVAIIPLAFILAAVYTLILQQL
jgi:hypothetical protein